MSRATLERRAFVDGLFQELARQLCRYSELTKAFHELQGRVEISEKAMKISRDHLYSAMEGSDEEVPEDWKSVLKQVRFVGMRTADACLEVLREEDGRVSTDDLLFKLNEGMFRFSSPYPLREINAAMLRHPHVKREEDVWVYRPPKKKETVDVDFMVRIDQTLEEVEFKVS